jgi:hypothetical protein
MRFFSTDTGADVVGCSLVVFGLLSALVFWLATRDEERYERARHPHGRDYAREPIPPADGGRRGCSIEGCPSRTTVGVLVMVDPDGNVHVTCRRCAEELEVLHQWEHLADVPVNTLRRAA